MSAGRWTRGWQDLYRRALPAYWLFLAVGTHIPPPQPGRLPASDKTIHIAVYAVLALLFWKFFETLWRPLPPWFVWFALVTLGGYAALDEWTQQFVGRGTDPIDWLADMAGIVPVLLLLEAWRRRRAPRSPDPVRD